MEIQYCNEVDSKIWPEESIKWPYKVLGAKFVFMKSVTSRAEKLVIFPAFMTHIDIIKQYKCKKDLLIMGTIDSDEFEVDFHATSHPKEITNAKNVIERKHEEISENIRENMKRIFGS